MAHADARVPGDIFRSRGAAGRVAWPAGAAAAASLSDPMIVRALQRFVAFASLFTVAIGLLGLGGWTLDTVMPRSAAPGQVSIDPLMAIALASCGGSLWHLRTTRGELPHGGRRRAGRLLAAVAAILGLWILSGQAGGWVFGTDRIFVLDSDPAETFANARPDLLTSVTALDGFLVGLALLCLDWRVPSPVQWNGPAQVLAFAANTGALVGLLDVLLGYRTSFTAFSVQAIVTLFLVSFAVACARTDSGLGALFVSTSYGGVLTRWLWPAVIVVPLAIGGASWKAHSAGVFSEWTGITVIIVAMITLLAASTVWSAQRIDRSEGERTRAEDALRESEATLTRAQAIAHIGSWHLDVTRNRLTWSDEVFRIFGVMAGTALTYESFLDSIHPADREAVDRAWTATTRGAPYDIEHRITVKGTVKWVRERAEVEFDAAGRALRGVGTVQDITERKRAQQDLVRVNRALKALSLCNQALIRASEESGWLHQVCDIVVKEAGYRFCWVGRRETDEAKTVTAVASAGTDEGYLKSVAVTWADTERGRGPVGKCIRTGQMQLVKDTATDPAFAPWRAEASRRGYGSIIAIPLTVAAERYGALAIYAADVDAFSGDEVELLTELAGDLAFGVETLRVGAERQRAEAEVRSLNADLESRVRARTADLQAAWDREATIGFKIQQMLLLTQPPTDVPGLQVAALTVPSQRIDGDFYDFFRHENKCLDVIVADVMGKGVPAALLAGATKSNVLEALCHLMAMSSGGTLPEPSEIITLAHADMVRQLIDLESFVTLCYARLDVTRRVIDLVDCGHTGMIVLRRKTGRCELVHGNSLPLGIKQGEIFGQIAVPFEPGDLFVFYSDGITDVRNRAREMFGLNRLISCIEMNRELDPDALVRAIRSAAVAFAGTDRPTDDLTCVAVKALEVTRPVLRSEQIIRSDLKDLRRARSFVREFCGALPGGLFDEAGVAALELAVNEAVCNIMKHAYHGRPDQWIQLEAEYVPERLSIRLHHLGDSFDPATVPPPAFDGSRESGFGVYLIANSVDDVRYSRDERGRNCIVLTKDLGREKRMAAPCN